MPIDFSGWVMVNEAAPGVLLQTDIVRAPHHSLPCDIARGCEGLLYSMENPEEDTVICQRHLEGLYAGRKAGGFLMGLPTN